MNKINQSGLNVIQTKNSIIVNGVEYPLPDKVKSSHNRMSMINGRITINGYRFNPETGEFIKSYQNIWFWLLFLGIVHIIYKLFIQ